MEDIDPNRRRYPRYDTEMEVYFKVRYDINIRVEFHVVGSYHEGNVAPKYFGLCNNVSVEGLLVVSEGSEHQLISKAAIQFLGDEFIQINFGATELREFAGVEHFFNDGIKGVCAVIV